MFLSWIIPAYNEERRIEKTIREVFAYLDRAKGQGSIGDYEVIVASSASTDRTKEIVLGLKKQFPALLYLDLENRGKGWAVKQGMLHAAGSIRLFSDADNSTPPESFDAMIPFFRRGCDVVISSRDPHDAPGAARDVKETWYREILGRTGNVLIQLVGVWGIYDTQNGFKALTEKAAKEIFSRTRVLGFAFDIEMLVLARAFGFKIAVIPVRWRFDPDSKVTLKAYLQVFGDVFRIRWNKLAGVYRLQPAES